MLSDMRRQSLFAVKYVAYLSNTVVMPPQISHSNIIVSTYLTVKSDCLLISDSKKWLSPHGCLARWNWNAFLCSFFSEIGMHFAFIFPLISLLNHICFINGNFVFAATWKWIFHISLTEHSPIKYATNSHFNGNYKIMSLKSFRNDRVAKFWSIKKE